MARVLLVEDDAGIRGMIRGMLLEHDLDEASDGREGLHRLETGEYDLLIVNFQMPRMDGLRMLERARGRLRGRVPVIFRTAGGFPIRIEELEAIDRAFLGCIPLSDLRAAVDELLDQRADRLSRVLRTTPLASERAPAPPVVPPRVPRAAATPNRRAVAEAQLLALWTACNGTPVREILWCQSPWEALQVVTGALRRIGPWALRNAGVPAALARGPFLPRRAELPWRLPDLDLRAAIRDQLVDEFRAAPDAERCLALLACLLAVPGAILEGEEGPASRWADWHWLLGDWMAVVSEPPVAVHRDAAGRLHHDSRPAIEYADGFGVYMLEGHRVDRHVVEAPEAITVQQVQGAWNAELRRLLRERYGEERYLRDVYARLLGVDTVPVLASAPEAGSLTRALLEDHVGRRYLVASDGSTKRVYHMRVPRSCETCVEAYEALAGRRGGRTVAEA